MQTIKKLKTYQIKDGVLNEISESLWNEWTFGNFEQKVAYGLTTIDIPENLQDRPVKFNLQTMQWEDASEDTINQIKLSQKHLSDELKKAQNATELSNEEKRQQQQVIKELENQLHTMEETISQLSFQLMSVQGGQTNE